MKTPSYAFFPSKLGYGPNTEEGLLLNHHTGWGMWLSQELQLKMLISNILYADIVPPKKHMGIHSEKAFYDYKKRTNSCRWG